MKKSKIALGALGFVSAANAIHAAVYRPKEKVVPVLTKETVNVARYRNSLSKAIQFKTISHRDSSRTDWKEFERFHAFLDEAYPLIKQNLTKEIVPPANLVYLWKGARSDLEPIALLAHQDVVPVTAGTENDWTHPAFDGVDDGEFIWGRGALDMKNHLIAVMEAVEALLEDGFRPQRDVYLLFGDNEEVVANSENGASDIMKYLKEKGVRLDSVLDEGGAMLHVNVPGVMNNKYLAGIGIAEKGFCDIALVVNAKGGHSSQPPKHSALGILAGAIQDVENHQFKATLSQNMKFLLDSIGRHCTYPVRLVTCNLPLLYPAILQVFKKIPPAASMVRTTTAVTMAQGSPASNVLPQKASATINFRAMPGTTIDDIVRHLRKAIKNKNVEIHVLNNKEASSYSPTDSRAYKIIARLAKSIEPNAIISPFLVMGGTDACNYEPICDNIYRYAPFKMDTSYLLLTHGTNERMPISAMADGLVFFKNYIREASDE